MSLSYISAILICFSSKLRVRIHRSYDPSASRSRKSPWPCSCKGRFLLRCAWWPSWCCLRRSPPWLWCRRFPHIYWRKETTKLLVLPSPTWEASQNPWLRTTTSCKYHNKCRLLLSMSCNTSFSSDTSCRPRCKSSTACNVAVKLLAPKFGHLSFHYSKAVHMDWFNSTSEETSALKFKQSAGFTRENSWRLGVTFAMQMIYSLARHQRSSCSEVRQTSFPLTSWWKENYTSLVESCRCWR